MKPDENSQSRSLWPTALVAFFSIVILSSIGFVVFCTINGSELVAPDYYEKEVRYGEELARIQRAAALHPSVAITYDPARNTLVIKIPREHAQSGLNGTLEMYRASSAGMDRVFPLATDADGHQLLPLAGLASGPWDVKLSWKAGGMDYQLNRRLIVQPSGAS